MSKMTYTTILHGAREQLGLSLNEYAVADIIYQLQSNPRSSHIGWCYKSKKTIGECVGITEQGVHKILNKLYAMNLIEKDEETKHIRVSDAWYEAVMTVKEAITKQSLGTPNEVSDTPFSHTKQSLATGTKQSLDNNNSSNNNKNIHINGYAKWTDEDFLKSIDESGRSVSDELRKKFIRYWTEPDAKGIPKYKGEKTWKTAFRLDTFIENEQRFKKKFGKGASNVKTDWRADKQKREYPEHLTMPIKRYAD